MWAWYTVLSSSTSPSLDDEAASVARPDDRRLPPSKNLLWCTDKRARCPCSHRAVTLRVVLLTCPSVKPNLSLPLLARRKGFPAAKRGLWLHHCQSVAVPGPHQKPLRE